MTVGPARRRLFIAMLFLLPNLLGFLVFTAGPIAFSLAMSFTDWALTRHNALSETPIRFVGLENYQRLLFGDESHLFWDYLGNTIFLMIGIPIGIAGSLALALMLNARSAPTTRAGRVRGVITGVALTLIAAAGVWLLTAPGPEPADAALSLEAGLGDLTQWKVDALRSQAAVLAVLALGAIVTLGLALGTVFFRTIFYLPSLLAGVALFLLWKTLYKPRGGLINAGLDLVLQRVQDAATSAPAWLWHAAGVIVWLLGALWAVRIILVGVDKLRHAEAGPAAFLGRIGLVLSFGAAIAGVGLTLAQLPPRSLLPSGRAPLVADAVAQVITDLRAAVPQADEAALRAAAGALGAPARPNELIAALVAAVPPESDAHAAARRIVHAHAPRIYEGLTAGDGLAAPEWLIDAKWAKTSLIIMGIWAGLGGSTMLLYLAGLSNIPPELYEAADIDGATGWQRFVHVTWPQLAPTTFFIVVMSTIGGLQGGFEQAMVMTQGKADTITLAYYIYNLAFTDQFQLGLASAVAWIMFIMIFVMTALNFRIGSQLTND